MLKAIFIDLSTYILYSNKTVMLYHVIRYEILSSIFVINHFAVANLRMKKNNQSFGMTLKIRY